MLSSERDKTKVYRNKFIRHLKLFMWKNYLQRIRRWQILSVQVVFAGLMFLLAVFAAKPVFLTPLQDAPRASLTQDDIMTTLSADTQLGYAPDTEPYKAIMEKVAKKLKKPFMTGSTEQELSEILYENSKGQLLKHHIIWVVWKEKQNNTWKLSIRSTELANLASSVTAQVTGSLSHTRHLSSGFLVVQLAVSEALLETESKVPLRHKISGKESITSHMERRRRAK